MTQAGDLKFRVSFESRIAQDGAGGGIRGDWGHQFTRWAQIKPLQGGETVMADRLTGTQPVLIIVRNDRETQQIAPDWRAVERLRGGEMRFYALKTAEDMDRCGEFLTLLAVAGDADGR